MSAERKVFGRLHGMESPMPDPLDIQLESYRKFLQADVPPQKRRDEGLQAIFKEIFPVVSFDGRYKLDFVSYNLEPEKKSYLQALSDGESYVRPLKVSFRLMEGEDVREEEVFLGDMPIMTPDGAFVINGAERVVVSQLHRSPGISSEKQVHANGQTLLSVRIIPDRGNWIEIMFDTNDVMWCFMDQRRRRRKFYATTLLRAFGYGSDTQLMELFYEFKRLPSSRRYTEGDLRMMVKCCTSIKGRKEGRVSGVTLNASSGSIILSTVIASICRPIAFSGFAFAAASIVLISSILFSAGRRKNTFLKPASSFMSS